MTNNTDFSMMSFYKKILPEVANVAEDLGFCDGRIDEKDIENITSRICEGRKEDEPEFPQTDLAEIEALEDDDDWQYANDGFENMIVKYLKEKQEVQQ